MSSFSIKYKVAGAFTLFIALSAFFLVDVGNFTKIKNRSRSEPGSTTIELRPDGFFPPRTIVSKGALVQFETKRKVPFWPASNYHPSHGIYPEFDAKKPIQPGEDWSFKFDRVGTWRYHDHLHPLYRGAVEVIDEVGSNDLSNRCKEPNRNSLPSSLLFPCWEQEIEAMLKERGPEEAWTLFSDLYHKDPSFAAKCHDLTHLLGDTAYHLFRKTGKTLISPETRYCGYGFYHGFIEALLYTEGKMEEAWKFCDMLRNDASLRTKIQNPTAIYACYHGIGHGTFDTLDKEIWGNAEVMVEKALRMCERIPTYERELKKQCATGIFNALAIGYINHDYGLQFKEIDPLRICRIQTHYIRECYTEITLAFIRSQNYDFSKSVALLEGINDGEGARGGMVGYIADELRQHIKVISPFKVGQWCLRISADLREACMEGAVIAFLGWGVPGNEHQTLLEFCRLPAWEESERSFCFQYMLPRLGNLYSSQKVEEICNKLEDKYKNFCVILRP